MNTQEQINTLLAKLADLRQEIHKVIFGQEEVVSQLLISLLAGGHALIEGVPGLAKTLLVSTLAEAVDLSFKRIQFTPDLMPSDILGTEVIQQHASGQTDFRFVKGPIFAHIVLADEVNRTPPKTQAALLECMQERHVTYAGQTYPLPRPFFILATQNPIEQAGTYPLPEAQLDRFLLYIKMPYPSEEDELKVLNATTGVKKVKVNAVIQAENILELQDYTRQVSISPDLVKWVNHMVRSTRPHDSPYLFIKEQVTWGAGPRAGQALILCAKANALLNGRFSVLKTDIETMTKPVLRHRIRLNYSASLVPNALEKLIESLIDASK